MADKEAVRHRVQLDFSPAAYKQLQELKQRAGVKRNGEVVRRAMCLMEWYLRDIKATGATIITERDGSSTEVRFDF